MLAKAMLIDRPLCSRLIAVVEGMCPEWAIERTQYAGSMLRVAGLGCKRPLLSDQSPSVTGPFRILASERCSHCRDGLSGEVTFRQKQKPTNNCLQRLFVVSSPGQIGSRRIFLLRCHVRGEDANLG